MGLVEFRRGRGVSVTGIAPQRSLVVAKARELVAVAQSTSSSAVSGRSAMPRSSRMS